MPPQLYVGLSLPCEHKVKAPQNGGWRKPKGGLWTSTYLGHKHGSGWVQWCLDNSFRVPKHNTWQSYLLVPRPDARIYTINTYADLKGLVKHYPLKEGIIRVTMLDFERAALDWDGIHLTNEGNGNVHVAYPLNLNTWDCESTVWLRWCFEDVVDLGLMTFKLKPYEEG